jgi:hypothetical protein
VEVEDEEELALLRHDELVALVLQAYVPIDAQMGAGGVSMKDAIEGR